MLTSQDVQALRALNRDQGEVDVTLIKFRVALEKIFDTAENQLQLGVAERTRKVDEMNRAMEEVLEIAAVAHKLPEESKRMEALVRDWQKNAQKN